MEILTAIILIGSGISGASYFVMGYVSKTSVNGEVKYLNGIERAIGNMQNIVDSHKL